MATIAVAGLGYVGLSIAAMLSRHPAVVGVDGDAERVAGLGRGELPFHDDDLAAFLAIEELDLRFSCDSKEYASVDVVVVATPTDYDPHTDAFDTRSVEAVVADVVRLSPDATIVIKSTIPVGYVEGLRSVLRSDRIVFSPEFLREGRALHDCLHPSRIVVGDRGPLGAEVATLLATSSEEPEVPVLLTDATEAEAVKLFANTYLAMRVAFFNELDSFAIRHALDARDIIDGVGLDPRIGRHYNNPSFGYGGYCLPKDTRQLLSSYDDVPQDLIRAVVAANQTRKDLVAADILSRGGSTIGIYRLTMKTDSDNIRSSSVRGVLRRLLDSGATVMIYEPQLSGSEFEGASLCDDLASFKRDSDVIVANRLTEELADVSAKVYSRDLFSVGLAERL